MTAKRESYFSRIVITAVKMVPALFSLFNHFLLLVELDARRAGKSLITISVLALILVFLLTSIWICLLGMVLIGLLSLKLSWIVSLLIIMGINILLFIIMGLIIVRLKNKLFFPKTRRLLRNVSGNY